MDITSLAIIWVVFKVFDTVGNAGINAVVQPKTQVEQTVGQCEAANINAFLQIKVPTEQEVIEN